MQVAAWEAALLLVYYGLYILWMVFNTGLMRKIAKLVGDDAAVQVTCHDAFGSRHGTSTASPESRSFIH